jgi:hypothetical protein
LTRTAGDAKGGWLVFLAVGAFNVFQGAYLALAGGESVQSSIQSIAGVPWSELVRSAPSTAAYINDLLMIVGLFLAAFGILAMTVAVTGYRRGHAWAWYVMWLVPLFYSITAALLFARGEIYFSDDLSSELFAFLLVVSFLVQALESPGFRARGATGAPGGRSDTPPQL